MGASLTERDQWVTALRGGAIMGADETSRGVLSLAGVWGPTVMVMSDWWDWLDRLGIHCRFFRLSTSRRGLLVSLHAYVYACVYVRACGQQATSSARALARPSARQAEPGLGPSWRAGACKKAASQSDPPSNPSIWQCLAGVVLPLGPSKGGSEVSALQSNHSSAWAKAAMVLTSTFQGSPTHPHPILLLSNLEASEGASCWPWV